jgi:hypothetical protein
MWNCKSARLYESRQENKLRSTLNLLHTRCSIVIHRTRIHLPQIQHSRVEYSSFGRARHDSGQGRPDKILSVDLILVVLGIAIQGLFLMEGFSQPVEKLPVIKATRRTHTKSRRGCNECKKRKVKVCAYIYAEL